MERVVFDNTRFQICGGEKVSVQSSLLVLCFAVFTLLSLRVVSPPLSVNHHSFQKERTHRISPMKSLIPELTRANNILSRK